MSPINTENFIAPGPVETSRSTAAGFFNEQSVGESFDQHFRQAFQPDAAVRSSERRQSDMTSKPQQAERSDKRERKHEDSAAGDAVVDDARDSDRTNLQDTQRDTQEHRDNSSSSDPDAIESSNTKNRSDADQTQDNDLGNSETAQTQAIANGAELVGHIVAENAEHNQQANQISEQNADLQLSNLGSEQTLEGVETVTGDQAALNQPNAGQTTQSQADPTVESGKIVDSSKQPAIQNTVENAQDTRQAVDVDYTDATPVDADNTAIDASADDVATETTTVTNTSEEVFTQDASAQSQVASDKTTRDKNRRDSDRIETNAAEKASESDNQAAPATLASNATVTDSDESKLAQNAVDKIAASGATDKDTVDSKATSSQPTQSDISLAQRGQSGQETRAAASSGTVGEEIDTTDRVRFVQRVARAIEGAGRDGGTLRMRLHPSELGSLSLEVTIRDGALTAKIETETQAAKNILLDNLPALRDRLAQQDIKVQQFDVDYAGGNNDGSPQSEADQHQSNDRAAGRQNGTQTLGETETTGEDNQAAPRAIRLGEAAQLDFVA